MNRKKRILSGLLCVLLSIALLCACGGSAAGESGEETDGSRGASGGENSPVEKLSVVTTIFAPYDFTRRIAGGNADVTMLLPPGSESHSFEPTAQDILTIRDCDIFIFVGGESDEWVGEILSSDEIADAINTGEMKVLTLMDCVEVVEEDVIEGMEEEEEEEEGIAYDEHVWTSPRNAKLIVQKISDALCEADIANADTYKANTAAYLAELDTLDGKFRAAVDGGARKTIVFGDRFPFRYFTDAYGLTYYAAFPGCSTETEPSAKTVAFLIDKIKEEKIPVVFHIEMGNEKMAEAISEATGAKVLLLHACHNITGDDFEAGKTYMELLTANVEALKEALQ